MQRVSVRLPIRALLRSEGLWLTLVVAVGGWVRFSRIGEFDNQYYTATVASMLQSPHNLLFGSFDPLGIVMVDKPPGAFWVQAIFPSLFGMSPWMVNLPQAIGGTLAVLILYLVVRRVFGRVAAVAAALSLAVLPASIVIDSRNEPDGLLSFSLLLAAFCIIRAAETGRWRWLLAFAFLMGFAFNIKMLVAFVPLPAFLLYYLLATKLPWRHLAIRVASAVALLLVVSLSWATAVALTPPENRPYVGSTRDNSIWTLVFKYNGVNRFTSFTAPRPRQPIIGPQAGPTGGVPPTQRSPSPGYQAPQGGPARGPQGGPVLPPGAQQPTGPPAYQPPQGVLPSPAPPAIGPNASDQGVLGLLVNPLAAQLGWLLPMAVLALLVACVRLLPDKVYRRPVEFLVVSRESRAASQTVLWAGWLLTAVVVFGLADATTTHPYYLVGVAVPMGAVMGLGFALLWGAFRQGSLVSWGLPVALGGGAAYQLSVSRGVAGDWAVAVVLIGVLLAILGVLVALWRRLCDTPLASAAVAAGALALLVIPLLFGFHFGGRIARGGAGPGPPPSAPQINREQPRVTTISSYIRQQADAGGVPTLGAVSAREAAPFILAGLPAVAIGGFSGGDPVLTVGSFQAMAERTGLRYFLMPGPVGAGGSPGGMQQAPILSYISSSWRDVSEAVGLPRGSLYSSQSR
ncbi:MAG: glycosyltransferase family 39 protein [Chloroflexi bacterium]|nr:glycosyltransferase family 39 protein [Chloroflexota bacterium]